MYDDTICAPSTPPVNSTLAVIRISGSESKRAADLIFSSPDKIKNRLAVYGSIIDREKEEKIDDVILIFYHSPKSFTGEDMIEIICHGNQIIVHRILELLQRINIRMAEPGEFSKRAFLNGKIDLTEAEAINHLITARSDWEINTSLKQMHGSLRDAVALIKENITGLKADIEAGIDFIDQEIEFVSYEDARKESLAIREQLNDLLKRCRIGEKISRGIDITITGKPNVGKSSILNYILNQERAIVSDIPGTTRDIIRETIQVNGLHINLTDTAGIDRANNRIEEMGIELSRKKIESASIILFVIDASTGINESDNKIIAELKNKKCIYIINKTDLVTDEIIKKIEKDAGRDCIRFSALKGVGLKELEESISSVLKNEFVDIHNSFVADIRVIDLLEKALVCIKNAIELISQKGPIELIAFELQALLDNMSEITGEITPDDVLNSIFSRFCIGK